MNIHDPDIATPKVTTGALPASRKVYARPDAAPELRVPVREIALTEAAGEPSIPVYDTTGPYTDPEVTIDVEKGLARARTAWVRERGGVEDYAGRPIQPVDNGNVTGKHLARNFPTAHRPLRALDGRPVTQLEFARAGIITKEMVYIAERENLGRKTQARARRGRARRRRELRRGGAGVRDARVRAQRGGARARHHSLQHQPRRIGADDHREELPHQDQRQYRQLGGDVLGGRGGGENGVGDPLGRRHRDGPLDRPQHPQHARMDHPQRAGADRHRADLPGAGEGQRRSGQARLGVLQGHAYRAMRARAWIISPSTPACGSATSTSPPTA